MSAGMDSTSLLRLEKFCCRSLDCFLSVAKDCLTESGFGAACSVLSAAILRHPTNELPTLASPSERTIISREPFVHEISKRDPWGARMVTAYLQEGGLGKERSRFAA